VVEWEKEKYAVGYKCVTINDNFFPGHFPERAIMPGGDIYPNSQQQLALVLQPPVMRVFHLS
jgi:3-hydroxymyristoyl/3-hydroxydecanoyl-(acyl carrier protein) dehydratase